MKIGERTSPTFTIMENDLSNTKIDYFLLRKSALVTLYFLIAFADRFLPSLTALHIARIAPPLEPALDLGTTFKLYPAVLQFRLTFGFLVVAFFLAVVFFLRTAPMV